jgi:hypothetical protein
MTQDTPGPILDWSRCEWIHSGSLSSGDCGLVATASGISAASTGDERLMHRLLA